MEGPKGFSVMSPTKIPSSMILQHPAENRLSHGEEKLHVQEAQNKGISDRNVYIFLNLCHPECMETYMHWDATMSWMIIYR